MYAKKENGISLITLIITIIVVVILTAISMNRTSKIPDDANYTKYMQEMKNVQTGVDNVKVKNARKGSTEAILNAGFEKVYLEDVPSGFVSFGSMTEPVYGYLVSMETIEYGESVFGKAFTNYASGDTLRFGDKDCDVFVYDAEWTVYYVKGLEYDGSMNYTFK